MGYIVDKSLSWKYLEQYCNAKIILESAAGGELYLKRNCIAHDIQTISNNCMNASFM